MRYILFIITIISIASCAILNKTGENYKVQYYGALKNMMHEGIISANVDLEKFEGTKHLYALGAIENLKGEIQIFDSKVSNTMVIDNKIEFDNTFGKKATLFVYATVSKWTTIEIPDDIITYDQLENFVAKSALKNGIKTDAPFPFLLEGTPKSFDWHIINWKEGDMDHSHEKHIHSGLYGTIKNQPVEMLGFYSDSHHAIFTHHTTNMHIHVKTNDKKVAGHVDGLVLDKGMVLKLPHTK